jgi:hypothetical protein
VTTNPERVAVLLEDEDYPVEMGESGEVHLVQDFEVPNGAMAVRMQVGGAPVTIVGWVDSPEAVPDLLVEIAEELRSILAEREAADDVASDSVGD